MNSIKKGNTDATGNLLHRNRQKNLRIQGRHHVNPETQIPEPGHRSSETEKCAHAYGKKESARCLKGQHSEYIIPIFKINNNPRQFIPEMETESLTKWLGTRLGTSGKKTLLTISKRSHNLQRLYNSPRRHTIHQNTILSCCLESLLLITKSDQDENADM
jgi:hypothetical protein